MKVMEMPMDKLANWIKGQFQNRSPAVITVTGDSMIPMLYHKKSLVWLEQPSGSIRLGDVVLFQRKSGVYVLHRVVKIGQNQTIWCCGDHCRESELVAYEQVVGVVMAFTRKGKRLSCKRSGYKVYVWFMVHSMWCRKPYLSARRILGRLKRRIRREK